ncbi:carbamoyltransferase HypF [Undibacterium sp. CY18W]|uniref:Carbamoyltransferase HypF n=1 Tax=Undibacterium hunanense TaxID=2762292 RepID=A0ABR6ZNN2_9BURK|nr:carbamoyltransferase HypF [Undibacterium hunanense]
MENQEIRVKGTVQGVGFRPAVYRLALECQLHGEVSNDTDGVLIRLSGMQNDISEFLQRLEAEAPPLAKIDSISTETVSEAWEYEDFRITQSTHTQGRTEVVADAATCKSCLAETMDPAERRYRYPFTNCTHCGPRLSIIEGIPYDRERTTMKAFTMCPACQKEYDDPLDRRFHAQPIACHVCGPQLFLHETGQLLVHCSSTDIDGYQDRIAQQLQHIDQALKDGKIVAIKGLGGFHLCCDATSHDAVQALRQRKQRYAKPFAVMTHELACIQQYCAVDQLEAELLQSVAAPIVLLEARQITDADVPALSADIAPGSHLLGFMLPYTPLHHMVCQQFGRPLVMTSGNVSGEPQIIDNEQALEKLAGIADLIVCHNRDIANRIDDTVVRCVAGKARILRRARGYAPRSIPLPAGFEKVDGILAYGAELKSTFCLVKQGTAILSQHQGDLEDISTLDDYEHNLALYQRLFEMMPVQVAQDMHPEYVCNKLAHDVPDLLPSVVSTVQHHHAHIASAMAENQIALSHPPVLGIALDGLGLGDDGQFWGGEFLLTNYRNFQRLARFKPVAMPGAAQAIRQPWRNTYAHILNGMQWDTFIQQFSDTDLAKFFSQQPITILENMLASGMNCPLASSTGRLFDAVAAAVGLHRQQVQFEGQAAMELEMLVDKNLLADCLAGKATYPAYDFCIEKPASSPASTEATQKLFELNAASMWPQLLGDLQQGLSASLIATRFHAGLIKGITAMVCALREQHVFKDVVLSGGCMQNAILLAGLEMSLREQQFNCLSHTLVPSNDGGIALGQAAIAAARSLELVTVSTIPTVATVRTAQTTARLMAEDYSFRQKNFTQHAISP